MPSPLVYKKFTGINNVLPSERLGPSELAMASNVDIGHDKEVRRRAGFTQDSSTSHTSVWEASAFTLAVKAGDLVNAGTAAVLHASLGTSRVWYVDLPDGRTAYSNGTACGVVTAAARTTWGVPIPATVGTPADTAGSLYPGTYQYSLAYKRTSSGLEGAPAYAAPVTIALGGLALTSLPTLAGHSINVYLTSHYGGQSYYAGNTATSSFSFTGHNKDLVLPCRTDFLSPAPVGKLLAVWNGRALVAVGPVLYASRHGQFELFDLRRDYKQFTADITLVQPVDDGIYVGTGKELAFLAGDEFDKLKFQRSLEGAVVLGSGVAVPGELITQGQDVGKGQAMICIADRGITAGFNSGEIVRLTEGRYTSDATEVAATFRMAGEIPQYLASVLS